MSARCLRRLSLLSARPLPPLLSTRHALAPLRLTSRCGCYSPPRAALSTNSSGGGDKDKAEEKKPTRWEQLKGTFREHGLVFVGYYATTWTAGFGVCWGGVTIAGLDGVAILQYVGVENFVDLSMFSPRVINALIALELNELLEWVRLPLIIATTPRLSRYLRGKPEEASKVKAK